MQRGAFFSCCQEDGHKQAERARQKAARSQAQDTQGGILAARTQPQATDDRRQAMGDGDRRMGRMGRQATGDRRQATGDRRVGRQAAGKGRWDSGFKTRI